MDVSPLILAPSLMFLGYVCALAAWPTLKLSGHARGGVLILIAAIEFSITFLEPHQPVMWKVAVTMQCMILGVKLLDLHIGAADWRTRTLGTWVLFLINPFVLVYRKHILQEPRPKIEALQWIVRGVLEFVFGVAMIFAAFRWRLHENTSWVLFDINWLEHSVKAIGFYFCGYDGMFVIATGALRLMGCNVMDLSRHPIIAATPAEFWRRYNRSAGEYLYEDVMKPLVGSRRPILGIFIVFLANGLLHEYLLTAIIGRITGYQMAFFGIHALAVMLTFRLRPRGVWRIPAILLTFSFSVIASVFFFLCVDLMFNGAWFGEWGSGFESGAIALPLT